MITTFPCLCFCFLENERFKYKLGFYYLYYMDKLGMLKMFDVMKHLKELEKRDEEVMRKIKENTIYVHQKGNPRPFLIVYLYPEFSVLNAPENLTEGGISG